MAANIKQYFQAYPTKMPFTYTVYSVINQERKKESETKYKVKTVRGIDTCTHMALKICAVLDIYLFSESSTLLHRSSGEFETSDAKPCADLVQIDE